MKIKNILIGTGVIMATSVALYHASVIKKAKAFEANLDKRPESLDEVVLYGGKMKDYQNQTMQNTKIGAFFGGMQLDFSEVTTEKDAYRLDINIVNGGLNIIVPDNFRLKIVDSCKFGGIADHTVCTDPENSVALSVFANITCGGLNFENPSE
ncbi:LiaF domain-containing protein [Acetobacterium wieringae]|uniref:LiaF domain-containing protein n=1 Tax=Acetobacterium wieringae TaxID=52694 RepID=UPI0026F0F673|nr:LiaF domain-containing protein [Acetobacterium wieringae]